MYWLCHLLLRYLSALYLFTVPYTCMMLHLQTSACLGDSSFGPIHPTASSCRDDFDFTTLFEQTILSIAPSSIFHTLALWRFVYLVKKPRRLGGGGFQTSKLIAILIYAIVQLTLLVFACLGHLPNNSISIAAAALSVTDSALILGLSFLEHSRSLRTSNLLNVYLLLTLLFDVVQCRTLWLIARASPVPQIFAAGVSLKVTILLLEAQGKSRWMNLEDKQGSPEETSGVFNISLFYWLNLLIAHGWRQVLSLSDLYPLDRNLMVDDFQAIFWAQWANSNPDKKLRLISVVLKALGWRLLAPILPRLALVAFTFCQPLLVSTLLDFLQSPSDEASANKGYGLIGACIIIYSGIAFSTALYWYLHYRSLALIRSYLVLAIFERTTQLSTTATNNSAAVTIMSTDIQRIQSGCQNFHEFWANLVEVIIASWLLERELGLAFLAPLGVILICTLSTLAMGKFAGKRQEAWMKNIQMRVGSTANMIANMSSLKISGLAKQMTGLIQDLRAKELASASRFRLLTLVSTVIAFIPLLITPVITFAATSNNLDTTRIFTSLSYLLLVSNPLSQILQSIPQLLAAVTCFGRIQEFLENSSNVDNRKLITGRELNREVQAAAGSMSSSPGIKSSNLAFDIPNDSIIISVQNGTFGWHADGFALRDINMNIRQSQITVMVGPVASGKSTLCKALLGETPIAHGDIRFRPTFWRVGYCDQSPFLKNESIRQNIIGFSHFESEWYNEVLHATVLMEDFSSLPEGDLTIIGTNGVKLSGGQMQRVAISRALYSRAKLLIFDDCFSGLDGHTEDQVISRVFCPGGILRRQNFAVVLSTHSAKYLPYADQVVDLGDDGRVSEPGSFRSLPEDKQDVHDLKVAKVVKEHMEKDMPEVERIQAPLHSRDKVPALEDRARQVGDTSVYRHYFSSIGYTSLTIFFLFGIIFGFLFNFSSVWLKFWSDKNDLHDRSQNSYYLGVYAMFRVVCLFALAMFVKYNSTTMVIKCGIKLHLDALQTVMNASLLFLSTTDTGVTINRFSQDMSLIDTDLAYGLSNTALSGSTAIGQAAVIATLSPYIVAGYPILIGVLYCVQGFYLRTSRQLRFLDLESKAPLYTNFLETLTGLTTIRAFGWVDDMLELNRRLLDSSQRPAYLLSMIQQWLRLTINLIIAAIATILVTLATQLHASSGFTGLGLVSLMSFSEMLSAIVISWTQLEISIGAVARLKSFGEMVKSENLPSEIEIPPEDWPQRGAIEMKNVSASYLSDISAPDTSLALCNISLTISPGEKVAICGRTGSGKSTLLSLLLNLLSPLYPATSTSHITIDSLPLSQIHRQTLRARLIAIPQTPFFLPSGNSILNNLDPYNSATLLMAESVLRTTSLWDIVIERGGLNALLEADTLSRGQKQLFSLARAVLRARVRAHIGTTNDANSDIGVNTSTDIPRGGVLLLDEVSSSVDTETDKIMQAIIRREFSGYTIIAVAHRVQTVMDFDTVFILEAGEVVEVGCPRELVGQEGSWFGRFAGEG